MKTINHFFLDFEASSLSWESYPIEVAWGNELSNIMSYLISPESIDSWTDWNPESEKIHKINRLELIESGTNPTKVCELIANDLSSNVVYTDNPDWDSLWLRRLFMSCDVILPPIDIRHVDSLLIETVCPDPINRINGLFNILQLKSSSRKMVKGRHRAAVDVEYLINLYKLAKNRTSVSTEAQ
jgi:hypothetical protein